MVWFVGLTFGQWPTSRLPNMIRCQHSMQCWHDLETRPMPPEARSMRYAHTCVQRRLPGPRINFRFSARVLLRLHPPQRLAAPGSTNATWLQLRLELRGHVLSVSIAAAGNSTVINLAATVVGEGKKGAKSSSVDARNLSFDVEFASGPMHHAHCLHQEMQ